MKANEDIRERAREKNVKLWEIASSLGRSDVWFSKKLRDELSEGQKQEIFNKIDEISERKAEGGC